MIDLNNPEHLQRLIRSMSANKIQLEKIIKDIKQLLESMEPHGLSTGERAIISSIRNYERNQRAPQWPSCGIHGDEPFERP